METPPVVRWPFRAKLVLFGALLSLVPLVALGALLIDINQRTLETLVREYQLAVADDLARSLDAEFVEAQNGLDAVGRVLMDPQFDTQRALDVATAILAANELLDVSAIYDRKGALVDVLREPVTADLAMAPQLDADLMRAAARVNVATFRAQVFAQEPRIGLVVALSFQNEIQGYASSLFPLAALQERVEQLADMRFKGAQDSLFVVDGHGRILAHPNRELSDRLTSAEQHPLLQGVELSAVSGRVHQASDFVEKGGRAMVGSLVGIPGRSLGILVQVPQAEAYDSLTTMRWTVVIALCGVSVVVLLLSFLLAKRMTQPINALTHFTGQLAQRRFDARVQVASKDELSVLAHALNDAAQKLGDGEQRIRKEVAIRSDLGRYLPAELVERVVSREQDMALGGTRREVSVLFADVVAFTPLTQQLDAEATVAILNELFTVLTEIVFRHGGTVDKFIGDCVMAVWGAPTADADHATHAIAAAEDMLSWLETGNAVWRDRYDASLRLAVGINSGEVVVGNIGSERRMEYTVIGDVVNVAARLESIARPQQILVSAATQAAASQAFEYVDLGLREMTGRKDPVHVFEVRP